MIQAECGVDLVGEAQFMRQGVGHRETGTGYPWWQRDSGRIPCDAAHGESREREHIRGFVSPPLVLPFPCSMKTLSGTHDVHALILGRAITGLQAFS